MNVTDREKYLDELQALAVSVIAKERQRLVTERAFLKSVLEQSFNGSTFRADLQEQAFLLQDVNELLGVSP